MWKPVTVQMARPRVGQTVPVVAPPGTMIVPIKPSLIDSPLMAVAFDGVIVGGAATLAVGYHKKSRGGNSKVNQNMSALFWAVTGLFGLKLALDVNRFSK